MRNHWNITQGVLHGHQPKQPKIMDWGYNSRLDNIHAATLLVKLPLYPAILKRRKEICMKYHEAFEDLPIERPLLQEDQVFQEYIIRVKNLHNFKKFMDEKGIELLIRDVTPNHKMYEWYFGKLSLPITEKLAVSSVRLPTYAELKDLEVTTIIKTVREFYGK